MNQNELEKYVCAYGKDIYSFCLSMTKNTYDAQDLYQETFVKFYDVADRKKTFSNVKSLLMSIAVNQYRNQKRKFVIRQNILGKPVALEENEDIISSDDLTPVDKVIEEEKQAFVREAIKRLKDKYRMPILLFYMEELSITEIADILRLPEGTVKTRLFRGKALLRKTLEELQYER